MPKKTKGSGEAFKKLAEKAGDPGGSILAVPHDFDPALLDDGKDALDEFIAKRTEKNPEFPKLVAEAEARRKEKREASKLEALKPNEITLYLLPNDPEDKKVIQKFEKDGYQMVGEPEQVSSLDKDSLSKICMKKK